MIDETHTRRLPFIPIRNYCYYIISDGRLFTQFTRWLFVGFFSERFRLIFFFSQTRRKERLGMTINHNPYAHTHMRTLQMFVDRNNHTILYTLADAYNDNSIFSLHRCIQGGSRNIPKCILYLNFDLLNGVRFVLYCVCVMMVKDFSASVRIIYIRPCIVASELVLVGCLCMTNWTVQSPEIQTVEFYSIL